MQQVGRRNLPYKFQFLISRMYKWCCQRHEQRWRPNGVIGSLHLWVLERSRIASSLQLILDEKFVPNLTQPNLLRRQQLLSRGQFVEPSLWIQWSMKFEPKKCHWRVCWHCMMDDWQCGLFRVKYHQLYDWEHRQRWLCWLLYVRSEI